MKYRIVIASANCVLLLIGLLDLASAQDKDLSVDTAEGGPHVSKLWLPGKDDRPGKYVCVTFSPDGSTYAAAKRVADHHNVILIRDVKTHAEVKRFRVAKPMRVKAIAFTPDGNSILCVGPRGISRWSAKTGKLQSEMLQSEISRFDIGDDTTFVISPNCSAFAAGNKVFDSTTGELRFQIDNAIGSPAFSPDGNQVAVVTPLKAESGITVFSATTGRKIHDVGGSSAFSFRGHGIVYTSDSRGIVVLSDLRKIVKYDARFGDWIWTSEKVPGASVRLAPTPDGTKLVSAANEKVQIWDVFKPKLALGLSAPGNVIELAVTDNSIAGVSDDGALCIWDITGLQTPSRLTRQQILKEIALVKGDQEAAIGWLRKDNRGKVYLEGDEVVGIGLFHSYRARSKVTDAWLGILVNFPRLERLDLCNSNVTGDGLKQLAPLRNLRDLTLQGMLIMDQDIHKLPPLKSLEILGLEGTNVSDAGMKAVARQQSIQRLELGYTHVTDAGLKHLAALQNLRTIYLSGTKITDNGLKHLSSHKTLEWIWLWETPVTDEGMKHVAQMQQLKSLGIGSTNITNEGIRKLAKCKNLEWLSVSDLKLTFDVQELGQLKRLQYLNLEGTHVTDEALQHIGQLCNLTRLDLINTGITDKGVESLSRLKKLEKLYLQGTKITDEGRKRLQRALPDCDVN